MINRLFIAILILALTAPLAPQAQDQSDGTLHVLRPSINAEQEKAEICLEFDHALDLSDHGKILAAIRLQSEGKSVPVTPSNTSLSSTGICVQSLVHEQDYSLTVADLHGAHGEKLNEQYKLSFSIPDRTPALAFAGDPSASDLPHYRNSDPVLRAVNVARVKIGLYRILDPARMADAYRQRTQTTLAPSESLTFAKDNGQLVWQGEFDLADSDDVETANQGVERPVPLQKIAGTLAPGLYFITASDDTAETGSKSSDLGLTPLAAQWFLYSDLDIEVFSKNDGFFIETQNADMSAAVKNVKLLLLGHDQQTLAEGKSDANGAASLALPQDKRSDAAIIVGMTDSGDVDFADLSAENDVKPENRFVLPNLQTNITTDRPIYVPGQQVYLTLTARNVHSDVVGTDNSTLQLFRPDHSPYETLPVPNGKAGISILTFSAPSINGKWQLQWQQADGRVLSQSVLRITQNRQAPYLETNADRTSLDNGDDFNLSIKSKTDNGKSVSYINGRVFVQWAKPDTMTGWNDYHFGNGDKTDDAPVAISSFLTDASGTAQLHVSAKPPSGFSPLRTAVITVKSDSAIGALDPDPISLPVRPDNYIIGVKSLAQDGKFSENSLARFDVIALGGDGKRRDAPDLKYQIYEEGRSFAWYQAEGRWDYKQLQQRRRISSGSIDVKATGANFIRWRVTAGTYTLEITDPDGTVLTRYLFNAGWGLFKPNQIKPADLKITSDQSAIQPGTAVKINFTLDHPALINAVLADDHIRKIIFESREAGDNQITFTPEDSWGDNIRIHIEAKEKTDAGLKSFVGRLDLPIKHTAKELNFAMPGGLEHITAGQELVLPIVISNVTAHPTFVNVLATPVVGDNVNATPASVLTGPIEADNAGKALVKLSIPHFSGNLRLKIIASNQNQWLQKEWSLPVLQTFEANLSSPSILREGDVTHVMLAVKNNGFVNDDYHFIMSATSGLKTNPVIDSKIALPAKTQKIIPFDLAALESGSKELKLGMVGARDSHIDRLWPIAVVASGEIFNGVTAAEIPPQQSWSPPREKTRTKEEPRPTLLFVSPQPLFNAPQILNTLINLSPFSTKEMAFWYQAVQLWQDTAIHTGLVPLSVLQQRQRDILERLLTRQKPDGSFPALPRGDSDLESTADALVVLARANGATTKSAIDAASNWLHQRLANTWFDEAERPARAAAFAALAAADRLDVASLRYFAETSTDKHLPPLAMAQLAAALAKSGDNDKADFWLKALHDQLSATAELLPAAAENPLFDVHDLLSVLQKLSADLIHNSSHDAEALSAFLHAVWIVNARSGNWSVSVNGSNKTQAGIFVIATSGKQAAPALHNPMDKSLFVTGTERSQMPADKNPAITRHIYQMAGNERAANELGEGETYVITLEGAWPKGDSDTQQLLIHDAGGESLAPLGCALDSDMASAQPWNWLKPLISSAVSACEANETGIDAILSSSGDKNSWRIAYLAKAGQTGTYSLAPATARSISAASWATSAEQRIEIK